MKYIALNMLLAFNMVIALGFMAVFWKNKKKAFFLGCICSCMPGIGVLFCLGYWGIEKIAGNKKGKVELLDEAKDMSPRKPDSLHKADRLVAVSEALALNDTKIKKEVLIGVLREDKTKYIEPLKVALQDEDTEASHYAAVALMEIKDGFHKRIEELAEQLEKEPDKMELLIEYESVLAQSIQSGLNDSKRRAYLEETYADVLDALIHQGKASVAYYSAKIKCEMRRKNFEEAYKYCIAFKEHYEEEEEPYLCLMQYYYVTKNHDAFKAEMEELKSSAVTLSRKGIQNMRFWLGGMA